MRISSKGDYGLRAIFDIAQRYGQGPVQSEDIAARQGIPGNYLNQLLILMRRAGLIESIRGPQGGHLLARSPASITLLDVVIVLEGPLMPPESSRDDHPREQPDDDAIVSDVWRDLRETVEQRLAAVTLEDLCQRKRQRAGDVMYYI